MAAVTKIVQHFVQHSAVKVGTSEVFGWCATCIIPSDFGRQPVGQSRWASSASTRRFSPRSSSSSSTYGQDRYRDQFRPTQTTTFNRPDTSRYNYAPNAQSSYRQGNATGSESNRGAGGMQRGTPRGSGRSNMKMLGANLRPVDWSTRTLTPFTKNFYVEHPTVAARTVPEIRQLLSEHEITVTGKQPISKPIATFDEASLPNYILQVLQGSDIKEPTSIQKIGLPAALSGRDIIGISRTGSGKTLAFAIPAMLHIDAQPPLAQNDGPIAVVLAPTRELTMQIQAEIHRLGKTRGIRSVAVYGGASKTNQIADLRQGAEIVVGCPGRVLDLLADDAIRFDRTTYLVLDEADRMLDMGFEPQIRKIVSQIRPDRQTLMYSATWPQRVEALSRDFCRGDAVTVKIGSSELHANKDIQQQVVVTPAADKAQRFTDWLTGMLRVSVPSASGESGQKILVFCSRKRTCDKLAADLHHKGLGATALHGDKSQNERDWAVQAFRRAQKPILVATDVAARGLDVENVTAVVNFDLPNCIEDYVHRIGRTGRAGKKGLAVTFFTNDDRSSETARMASDISEIMVRAGHVPPGELKALARRFM